MENNTRINLKGKRDDIVDSSDSKVNVYRLCVEGFMSKS